MAENTPEETSSLFTPRSVAAFSLIVVFGVAILFRITEKEEESSFCSVSYDALQIGMTLDQANKAAGCKATELSRADALGTTYVYYTWLGSHIMVAYVNGLLVTKSKL